MWLPRVAVVWRMVAGAAITAAAAAAAAAGDISKRDFALIQGAFDDLNSLLQRLDTSILALDEANIATKGPALLELAGTIRPSLMASAAQISTSAPLGLQETLNLNTAREALGQNINLTVGDLVRQRALFAGAGLAEPVAAACQLVRDMAGQFFAAVQAKLDPAAPSELGQLTAALGVFDGVVATFRGLPTTATGARDGAGSCMCVVTCPPGSFSAPLG